MFKIKSKVRKFNIPLRRFEKFNQLTQSQVNYLKDYSDRIKAGKGNPALLERIGAILRKPHIKDPIIDFKFVDNFAELYPKN